MSGVPEVIVVPGVSTETGEIFTAFRERPSRGRGWRLPALLALCGLAAWGVLRQEPKLPIRLETNRGARTVYLGMSSKEVSSLLGRPIAREQRGSNGLECFQYGLPTIERPTFMLYSLCYEDEKLREVLARRYNAWVVTPDGAISPAPVEDLEAP